MGDIMYQALYRKYRPTTFDEVVGQNVIIATLKNAIKNNRVAHAYLFTGPRGTGKTSTAKILAKTINCENLNNFVPCNNCTSCIQINNKQTTDIVEIDAASNNGVDEIRELKSKINLAPSNSKYKIYIIDEVHMLSTGAFNALLKTLEEPPSHIIFILATTEPHKIPQTILSRCQRFDFKKINFNDIKLNLQKICSKENINITEEALYEIAYLSDGGMRDSIGLLDQAIAYSENDITIESIHEINGTVTTDEIFKLVQKLLNGDLVEVLNQFALYDNRGKNMIKLLEEIATFLKNTMIYKVDSTSFSDDSYENLYKQASQIVNKDTAISYIKKIFSTINEMKNSDNDKIILELNLIDLMMHEKAICVKNTQMVEKSNKTSESVLKTEKENKIIVEVNPGSDVVGQQNSNKENNVREAKTVDEKEILDIKRIRINNALALFDKKRLLSFKNNINHLKNALLDQEFSQLASLILDGELKVLGDKFLVFLFSDTPMTVLFNQNMFMIDAMMQKYFSENLKCVAVDLEEWNQIKSEFNSKTKVYTYMEEKEYVEKTKKNENKNTIESLFNDIIEYRN